MDRNTLGSLFLAVVYWPFAGWLTGGLTAGVYFGLSYLIPTFPALVFAIVAQLIFTGALHEDGLADFCDGFGGGRDRDSVLRIMKDSHIGTYGVIGLICFYLLLISLLDSLPASMIALTIIAVDPFSKFCASQIINLLPYARKEGAKNKISYQRMTAGQFLFNFLSGTLPLLPMSILSPQTSVAAILPLLSMATLVIYMKRRIGGYTGDCCGATFLICEISMLFGGGIVAKSMKLVFVRHTSVAVPKGICYGNTDVPLASSFEEEATLVKEKLRPYAFDRVYCSPLSRCVRLADFCGFPDAIRDSRLKEMNFGDWEMKRYDDITDPKLQEWFDDYINVRPPGGESVIDQRKRLENFVAEIKEQQSGLTVGIFTHGGILINALVANTGKTYEEVYNDIQPYGSIVEIEL